MSFSDSLGIGNSTLFNLEQNACSINKNGKNQIEENLSDYFSSSNMIFSQFDNSLIKKLDENYLKKSDRKDKDLIEEIFINIEDTTFVTSQYSRRDATTTFAADENYDNNQLFLSNEIEKSRKILKNSQEIINIEKKKKFNKKMNQFPAAVANQSISEAITLNWSTDSVIEIEDEDDYKSDNLNVNNALNNQSIKPSINQKNLSQWNLPKMILREYEKKGITKLFDWQIECLSIPEILFNSSNLVYSAPTSAGKTLISEFIMIKALVEKKKKAIMILPFVSIVREKLAYLQDILSSSGYRIDGYYGGYNPPGGFGAIDLAVCTIEKANSIINKLLEHSQLDSLGCIVIDEIHLISDRGRGYILELLLAKILFMSNKFGFEIQLITMSATLANVQLLKKWLKAKLYCTNFRPVELREMLKIGQTIFDKEKHPIRSIEKKIELPNDIDDVATLSIETILEGGSVLIFCPTKDWCESLSLHISASIHHLLKTNQEHSSTIRNKLNKENLNALIMKFKSLPTGLDSTLKKTLYFGCAFHHAGLTTEERDLIESSFKNYDIRIIVATSTLSSGVNLPARRVIIRSPLFGGKPLNSLIYKQMIGRAGRTGKDTFGESLLICTDVNGKVGQDLVSSELDKISSCLSYENYNHLNRAVLEVISSNVVSSKKDLVDFLNCTLLYSERAENFDCKENIEFLEDLIQNTVKHLLEYEFIRIYKENDNSENTYVATRLGLACLASSIPPNDALILFSELQKARRCFVLESELHAIYLVTPYSVCYQITEVDWLYYLDLWEKLPQSMKRVGDLIGIKESFLVKAMRGSGKLDYKLLQIHKRFYTALALQELVNEKSIVEVGEKYKCTKGLLQSLQQTCSTFAGIVTQFCYSLKWDTLALIVSEFKERLFFGVHRDLIDLTRLPEINCQRARALFNNGIETLTDLANADIISIEKILHRCVAFESDKINNAENNEYEINKEKDLRNFYITGNVNIKIEDVSKILIKKARLFIQNEIGVTDIKWYNNIKVIEEQNINDVEENNNPLNKNIVINCLNDMNLQKEVNYNAKENVAGLEVAAKRPSNVLNLSSINGSCRKKIKSSSCLKSEQQFSLENLNQSTAKDEKILEQIKCQSIETSTPCNNSLNDSQIIEELNISNNETSNYPNSGITTSKLEYLSMNENVFKKKTQNPDKRSDENIKISSNVNFELEQTKVKKCGNLFEIESNNTNQKIIELEDQFQNISIEESESKIKTAVAESLTDYKSVNSNIEHLRTSKKSLDKNSTDSSFELSHITQQSLIKCPKYLNSSDISNLKNHQDQQDSNDYECIHIVDFCGNLELFNKTVNTISNFKTINLSIALAKISISEGTNIIGANLLQQDKLENNIKKCFMIDNEFYVDGISFLLEENIALYLNLQNTAKISNIRKIEFITKLFSNTKYIISIYDAKEQLKILYKILFSHPKEMNRHCFKAKIKDPKIASWLLHPDENLNFRKLTEQYAPEYSNLLKILGNPHKNNVYLGLDYQSSILSRIRASIETCITAKIIYKQSQELKNIADGQLEKFFYDLEMPMQVILSEMETYGFPVNEKTLLDLLEDYQQCIKLIENKIYELNGRKFNLASAVAVSKVLGLNKTHCGTFSTSRQILEKIDSPISMLIIHYRKLKFILSNNVHPLLKVIKNNRIHGNSITFSLTGRISMQEPNLQNVAKNFEIQITDNLTKIITLRSAFIAPKNKCLLSADFCQLELRILAHLSQDKILLSSMNTNLDLFTTISAKWNDVIESEVSVELRNATKQICYGIIYGMGIKALAESLKCPEHQALQISRQFHASYPGIKEYIEKIIKFAKQNGYVETITGRRRYLHLINSEDSILRTKTERQAVNTTIQGSASDIVKSAILRLEKNISKYSEKHSITSVEKAIRFVLHLHDELIYEIPEDKVRNIAKILKITLENCVQLSIPLRIKLKVGKSWGEMTEFKL